MKKQLLVTLGISAIVILTLGLVKGCQIYQAIAEGSKHQPPPESVTTTVVKEETWQRTLTAVGSLSPVQGIMIKAEEPGRVAKIAFESGQNVEQGAVIIALDTSVEEANLAKAQAMVKRTTAALERAKMLRPSNAVSQDDLDNWQAQNQQALAEVKSYQAIIDRKVIKAPFSGKLGIRKVNLGEFLSTGQEMIELQALEQLYLNFSLPEQYVSSVNVGLKVKISLEAYPDKIFEGNVSALSSAVDAMTRNFQVQAIFVNNGQLLRAGMFAKVSLSLGESFKVIAIPATSISYAPYGDSVFIVEKMKNNKDKEYLGVNSQIVELGEKKGDLVIVTKGLSIGQEIVTSGVFQLRPGAEVVINNSISPNFSLTPKPEDT